MYDTIIIGSGPAGLAAAIYAKRAVLNSLVIEQAPASGGQMLNTYEVDNYPGLPGINGFDLGDAMREHADKLGAEFAEDTVTELQVEGPVKKVIGRKQTYETRTIVLASGAEHRKLLVPGEEALTGRGVSYCATCDGAFFKDKEVAVIGGGDVALEDAILLAKSSRKVTVIHRRDAFRGARILQERLSACPNVEILWNTVAEEILGTQKAEGLRLRQVQTGEQKELPVDGVFIAVGIQPNSELARGKLRQDKGGYICAGEDTKTSVAGVFAAGDVRTKEFRQILTAAADGAAAVAAVENYLNTWNVSEI
ncbi:MAG: thioredoxin-disulfide reductase [Lachnospiraceae bacterium]|nr:thioredoxin-disulfide reductase [Lachnospiraceae bacterium]